MYYDNVEKLRTTSGGIEPKGNVRHTDNIEATFGTSQDLKIVHDGSNSFISESGTGNLVISTTAGSIRTEKNTGEAMIHANVDGSVDLYYDNSKKFETTTGGAAVVGNFAVGDITNATHHYDEGIHVHANGTGAVLHLTDNTSGSAASDGFDILSNAGTAYLWQRENANMTFGTNATSRWDIYGSNGHFVPTANNTYDIGTTSNRVRNIYTNDLNLSNEGSSNDVDGSWGDWTIQEGESDLFLKNNRSGKKYKFNLTEVS